MLLQRHTGRASLAVGTIVSDRRDVAAERTIGSFARETLLRADFGPKTTFRDVVLALRDRCREAMASLELPFEAILPALPPALRLRPPFRVMFVLHQRGANEPDAPPLPGLRVERLPVAEPRSHYLLDLVLHDTPAEIAGELAMHFAHEEIEFRRAGLGIRAEHLGKVLDRGERDQRSIPSQFRSVLGPQVIKLQSLLLGLGQSFVATGLVWQWVLNPGNGLQEVGALAADYASVYSRPDVTKNRSLLVNLAGTAPGMAWRHRK